MLGKGVFVLFCVVGFLSVLFLFFFPCFLNFKSKYYLMSELQNTLQNIIYFKGEVL